MPEINLFPTRTPFSSILGCGAPSNISDGYVVSDGVNAVYHCHNEYTLNGKSVRSCLLDGGGWGGVSPSCSEYTI